VLSPAVVLVCTPFECVQFSLMLQIIEECEQAVYLTYGTVPPGAAPKPRP